jgi:hypothetical protein
LDSTSKSTSYVSVVTYRIAQLKANPVLIFKNENKTLFCEELVKKGY